MSKWQEYCLRHPYQGSFLLGGFLSIIALILLFLGPLNQEQSRERKIQRDSTFLNSTFLIPVDSPVVPIDRRDNHITTMTTIITGYQSNDATLIESREASRSQMRSFYITLLVALISVMFLKHTKDTRLQMGLITMAIIVTLLFYGLDVNAVDLMERSNIYGKPMNNTLHSISKIQPDDSAWYSLNFSSIDSVQDSMSRNHLSRKINSAFHPTVEQWVLYILPLFLLGIRVSIRGRQSARNT